MKKEANTNNSVDEAARYKILSIANEAPIFIKTTEQSFGRIQNADVSANNNFPSTAFRTNSGTTTTGFPLPNASFMYVAGNLFGQDGVAGNRYLDVRLDAVMVKLDVKDINSSDRITLVNNVSISVGAGEMVALMGPSGAGKTSLLDVLSGKRRPSEGQVLINNIPLHDHIAETKHLIGFVPQDDVMHRDLTVFEVLHHAAKLKLPSDMDHDALVEKVDRLITQMGLAHIRDQIIGDEKTRGISGGQRKRVNIAIELITSPRLLFLDEPTSGLDAQSTLELLQILRGLADEGQTIIMTIHQPRKEAFLLLDNLILLANGGRLAFFGPVTEIDEYFYRVTKIQRDDRSTSS